MTNIQQLIADTAQICISNKISFLLKNTPSVQAEGTIECSGYFDEDSLVVATGTHQEKWLPILLHESCHLDQFVEKIDIWKNGENSIDYIDSWLNGKDISKSKLIRYIQSVVALELDCEIRSVKKIKKYDLEIDTPLYIQKANAYIFSYWATLRDKEWFSFPYNKKSIYSKMPKNFLTLREYCNENKYLNLYF